MLQRKIKLRYNTSTGRYDNALYKEVKALENDIVPNLQLYTHQDDIRRFLAKTNKTVDSTNLKIMNEKKQFDKFVLPVKKGNSKCSLTSMKLNIGDPVLAYKSSKKFPFHNNQQFMYQSCDEKNVNLQTTSGEEIQLYKDVFEKNFVPAFCITINRCQGSCVEGKFAVLDGYTLNKNDLNSAITRGKKWEYVFIDRLPRKIKPYKYTEYTVLNVSPSTFKASI